MNYPTLSEYVQAIRFSEDNFDKLRNLRPVLDADSNPIMSSGNFAVVFKMEDMQSGKLYAVKCFYKEQEGREDSYKLITSELEYVSSTFLTPIKYLEKELFVDTTQRNDTEFPVLLMDWVEGLTLDKYIRNNIHDKYKLSLIAYQFCRMGSWLLSQEFAHGDLKPDNIIVREDGQLVLVDYDGMFVPAMKGQKSRELGSVDYRHPLRKEDVFNSSIDDFSIASIALSLKAISLKPELLNEFGAADRLLFSAKDYQNIGDSECLKAIQSLSNDVELAQLLGLFYIAYARNELSNVSFKLFNIAKPECIPEVELSTEVTEEDKFYGVEFGFWIWYSDDGTKFLGVDDDTIVNLKIRDETIVVCDEAFIDCKLLENVIIPPSVLKIGKSAFSGCTSLSNVIIPDKVKIISDNTFEGCSLLKKIVLPKGLSAIGKSAFSECSLLKDINIPSSVDNIGESAFEGCFSIEKIYIPDKVLNIYSATFFQCRSLVEVRLPSVLRINSWAFFQCRSLMKIILPSSLIYIGERAFDGCSCLKEIILPSFVTFIGDYAFSDCFSLQKVVILSNINRINNGTFSNCALLTDIEIPISIESIGYSAFYGCKSLKRIVLPTSLKCIGKGAFSDCNSLNEVIILSSSVTNIDNYAFSGCKSLQSIIVPKGKTAKFRELLKNAGCDLSIIKEQDE